MGVLSLVLAFAAGALCLLGFLTSVIPVVGTVLSFSAPVAALAGIWAGGMSWSRARRERRAAELPVVGVILNAMAFVPALMVALTCGVCNAMLSGTPFHVERRFGTFTATLGPDGGVPLPSLQGVQGAPPTPEAGETGGPGDAGVAPRPGAGAVPVPPPSLPAGPRTPMPPAPTAE